MNCSRQARMAKGNENEAPTVSRVDAILRLPEVERMSGLKRTAIYERMAAGAFPQSVPLGVRHVGWLESEIQDWIRELAASRKNAA